METQRNNSQRWTQALIGLLFSSIFFLFTGTVQAQDWTFVPTPIGSGDGAMNSMHFIDKNTGWIVGSSGQGDIAHTSNGGIDWIVQQTPVSAYLSNIFFVNTEIGYAVGSKFETGAVIIFKTTDGGNLWLQQASPVTAGSLSDVCFINAVNGWAVGTDSESNQTLILHTVDGATWVKSTHPAKTGNLNAVTFIDANRGFIVGSMWSYPNQPFIFATIDGGLTWTEQSIPLSDGDLADVSFVNPDSGWAVGSNTSGAIVLKTTDGGANWSSLAAPTGRSASSVCFIAPTTGYLAVNSDSSALYKTTDGGDTWTQVASRVPEPYIDKVQVVRGSIHIFLLFSKILALLEEYGSLAQIVVTPPLTEFSLAQNYPNPFNPATIIAYQTPRSGHVSIKVYNTLGQEVAILVNEEKPAGRYQVEFNTTNLSSGIYFYKMRSGGFTESKKFNLMK